VILIIKIKVRVIKVIVRLEAELSKLNDIKKNIKEMGASL